MLPEIPYREPVAEPEPDLAQPIDDIRSVGELLVDADRLSRSLLLDVSGHDADALLRAWPHLVQATGKFWAALPAGHPAARQKTAAASATLERVSAWAATARRDMATSKWPTRGPSDIRIQEITHNLDRARTLVDAFSSELVLHRPLVQLDLDAARARALHVLYLSTHAVGVALIEHARGRATKPTRAEQVHMARGTRGLIMVGPAIVWSHRLAAAERSIGGHLSAGRYAGAISHTQPGDRGGLPRLAAALARFDVQAHRTLAGNAGVGDVIAITRTHHSFIGVASTLVEAGAATAALPQAQDTARIQTALTAAGAAWATLASRWTEFATPGIRVNPELRTSTAELRAACREVIDDNDHRAMPEVIAARVDLESAAAILARYLEAGADLAEATKIPLRDRADINAPVRTLVRRIEADLDAGRLSQSHAHVRDGLLARATRTNPAVSVPQVVRSQVTNLATAAGRSCLAAARSIADVDPVQEWTRPDQPAQAPARSARSPETSPKARTESISSSVR